MGVVTHCRVKRKYPDAKPQEYEEIDEDFKKFAECRSHGEDKETPKAPQPQRDSGECGLAAWYCSVGASTGVPI